MTPEEILDWEAAVRCEPRQKAQTQRSETIAEGLRYVDLQTGEEKWMSGSMFLAHVHSSIRKAVSGKVNRKALEEVVEEIGRHFGQLRAEVAALKTELAEMQKAMPPRVVGGKDVAA